MISRSTISTARRLISSQCGGACSLGRFGSTKAPSHMQRPTSLWLNVYEDQINPGGVPA